MAALGALLLAAALFLAGALEPLENRLGEARSALLSRPPTGQLAIVEIDAKSVAAIRKWPWSRTYHADLVRKLGAAGAYMIAFDVDLSAVSDPAGDAALGNALRKVQPVVLPIFQQRASDDADERFMIKSRPAAPFAAAWVGGVNILPDHDGIVRDFPAATMINGQIQPSMAVLLSENSALGDRTFMPDWSIDAKRIPHFSYIDVLEGRVAPRAIRGKRVIVGATAIELGDRYTIPRFGTVPGVVVQALAAESLMQHRALARSGVVPTLLGLLLVTLLIGAPLGPPIRIFPFAATSTVVAVLILPVIVQARAPLSVDTAPLLFEAMLLIGLRIIVEVRHHVRAAAFRDAETSLPNERALEAALEKTGQAELTVTAAAIDRFDYIRSVIGSEGVATLVEQASARIERALNATVYRVAPDTLAWIGSNQSAPDEAAALVAAQFLDPVMVGTNAIDVRFITGLAHAADAISPALLVEQSLAAVSNARSLGKSLQWFQGTAPNAARDLSLMGELRRGLEQAQLFVAYQPKLHLESGNLDHAEALVRWQHPTEGFIPPDCFIPLAEETGVIRELTRFVLGRVAADCRSAAESGLDIRVSVNVSAADIGYDDFADHVIQALDQQKLDPAQLTLEITESAIIGSRETALEVLHGLRKHGIRLSIDDYGIGQSTLSYLKTLPVNELKIDKSFVTSICGDDSDRIMVRSTIAMAHELGLSVVAEGVEDWETVNLLTKLGCDYGQGYLIGRAVTFDQFCDMARSGRPARKAA